MRLFRFNPTIREANKYLSKTVDDLLKKHGGVSNEDFERDLVAATGIGWKQVKNYKNHPKPGERLKDNSVVIKYIRECRAKDTTRKVRSYALAIGGIAVVCIFLYRYVTAPRTIESFAVHEVAEPLPPSHDKIETRLFLEVGGWILRLGPIKHSKVPLEKFVCSKLSSVGQTNCSFSERRPNGLFQVTLLMDGDFVRKYSVMTLDSVEIESLRKQLANRVDREIASVDPNPLSQKQFKVGDESLEILSNPAGPGSRPMLTVSVSFASL
ncbi:MAG: hypothetical protein BroJett040_10170 [Oligoflexia bacterium]|nr:MAG: hypothetical protein BroJett040_10170 [Oligoflexia bacterium]